jgi:ArsR family transcriptional regulator, arsenate/arsenite/antimonite-responsive transcriptional repressor
VLSDTPVLTGERARIATVLRALAQLGLSQPTVSHHLRLLSDAGLIDVERRGTWAYYRLIPAAVDSLRGALAA